MPRAFLTAYAPSGAAKVYAGEKAIFDFRLLAREGGEVTPEDLEGRTFEHRIVDAAGEVKKTYPGAPIQDAQSRTWIRFVCPSADTRELLGQADKVDLAHIIVEVVPIEDGAPGATEDEFLMAPSPWILWKVRAR